MAVDGPPAGAGVQTGALRTVWLIGWGTLVRKRVSLAVFAVAAAFLHGLIAVSFPAVGGIAAVESVVGTFPDGLRTLLRIAPNLQAGFGLQDYLAFSWFHPVFLGLGAAFVVGRAADGLAGEIERGSVYLVLSRPIRRFHFVLGKYLEMVAGCAVIGGSAWLGLWIGVRMTLPDSVDVVRYLPAAITVWLLFAALGGGAFVISALARTGGAAAGWGSAWTLIAFVLDVIPAVAGARVGDLNPWHHYYPQELVAAGRVDPIGLLVLTCWVVGSSLLAMAIFGRRDLA